MNKKTLYIILIIILFNFLLINIFKLQKEIKSIINKNNKVKGIMKNNEYKEVSKINDNNNGTGLDGVKEIMNDISELVPIDFNKMVESKVKFTPKYDQV
jgi:hypothetical protein